MALDLTVKTLGEAKYPSPLLESEYLSKIKEKIVPLLDHERRVRYDASLPGAPDAEGLSFESPIPRSRIFFEPAKTKVAIVTCGGLCPGLNSVVRSLVLELHYLYNVNDVWGIRYGYSGLIAGADPSPVPLTPELVSDIHRQGGTILGSSRGNPGVDKIVDSLVDGGISILFCIGGDGTLRGVHAIADEVTRRGLPLSVIGIPKTIDNDIPLVYRSFGFETAVEEAQQVLNCAHVEAKGAKNGVGLVKLMGRAAGFIAAHATQASGDVNYCLIPEINFPLDGDNGFLAHLRRRLAEKRHAVIALAEGAGQHLVGTSGQKDASGNMMFNDIGLFLKDKIEKSFKANNETVTVKYFDPSYIVRSVPANSSDCIFCANLARYAVHAAMAGKTDMLVGNWHGEFTYVPLEAVHGLSKRVCPTSRLWRGILSITGQPPEWL